MAQWCWRRLLRVPWTARRSNQSILKEISPGCSLEGCRSWNSNTLATSCEELTHWRRPWCWEGLGAGEGDDRGDGWMASLTGWTWMWVNSGSWWRTGRPDVLWFLGSQTVGHDWATELNWTLQLWSWVVTAEAVWLTKPQIFTIWPFRERVWTSLKYPRAVATQRVSRNDGCLAGTLSRRWWASGCDLHSWMDESATFWGGCCVVGLEWCFPAFDCVCTCLCVCVCVWQLHLYEAS